MTVNIRFCGGCNPRYDRSAFADRIRTAYPQIRFLMNESQDTDAVIVLCGCSAACANVTDSYGRNGRIVLWDPHAWGALAEFLDRLRRRRE